jgi:hypothetical protein
MFIPYQDLDVSIGSRIQQQQKRGGVKNLLLCFFCSHKFHADIQYPVIRDPEKRIPVTDLEVKKHKIPYPQQ